MTEKNIPTLFQNCLFRFGARPLFYFRQESAWKWQSWQEVGEAVEMAGRSLLRGNVEAGDHVGIVSTNRPEWVIADLAIQSIGAVTLPISADLSSSEIESTLKQYGAKLLFVEKQETVIPLETVIYFDGDDSPLSFASFCKQGKETLAERFYERMEKIHPNDLSTVLVSPEKKLTHREVVATSLEAASAYPISEDGISTSFLPLSHPFERSVGLLALLSRGAKIAFLRETSQVTQDLEEIKPTLLFALPETIDRFFQDIRHEMEGKSKPVRHLFEKSFREQRSAWMKPLYESMFYQKIRQRLGGRVEHFVSGGEAPPPDVTRLFETLGIPLAKGPFSL